MNRSMCAVLVNLALLSACHQSDSAAADADDSAGASAAENPKLVASYRARLVAQVPGSYRGQCGESAGSITVSPAGVVSAKGFEHDLNGANVKLSLSRTLTQGQPAGIEFRTGSAEPQWAFALVSGPGELASVTDAASTVKCEQVAQVTPLRSKPLYPPVAAFFTASPARLECAGSGKGLLDTGLQPITPGTDGVSVGKARFAFDKGIKTEVVAFEPDEHTLTYSVAYDDDATLALRVDGAGKLRDVMWTSTTGGGMICSAPRN